jgi:hypothetical protein
MKTKMKQNVQIDAPMANRAAGPGRQMWTRAKAKHAMLLSTLPPFSYLLE